MDMNRDEFRRTLREADREQGLWLTKWRDAMARIVGDKSITTDQKLELLGAPRRRQFMKLGGTAVLGTAVLAACGDDEEEGGDTTEGGGETTQGNGGGGGEMDVALARTAASLEVLAVAVYDAALGLELEYPPPVADAAALFRDHHQAHADALNQIVGDAGGEEVTEPNPFLNEMVVMPALPGLTSVEAVAMFARTLENNAAGTYTFAAGVLSTPELRQALIGIGGVEARHATALTMVLMDMPPVPRSFTNTATAAADGQEGRIPDEAILM